MIKMSLVKRVEHQPKFAINGEFWRDFLVEKVTVKDETTEADTRGARGDDECVIESCSQQKSSVKKRCVTTIFKPPQTLRMVRPEDRLPVAKVKNDDLLLNLVRFMRDLYRRQPKKKFKGELIASQLTKILERVGK